MIPVGFTGIQMKQHKWIRQNSVFFRKSAKTLVKPCKYTRMQDVRCCAIPDILRMLLKPLRFLMFLWENTMSEILKFLTSPNCCKTLINPCVSAKVQDVRTCGIPDMAETLQNIGKTMCLQGNAKTSEIFVRSWFRLFPHYGNYWNSLDFIGIH